MWALISGFLLPPVEAVIQQSKWSSSVRAIVNFLACCAVALGVVYWQRPDVTLRSWSETALLVLVTAIAVYKGLWTPAKVTPTIEKRTNVG